MVLRDLVNHPAVYSFCKRAITPPSKFAASAPFMPRAASRTIARWSLLNIFWSRGSGGNHFGLVQRTDWGSDHAPQTRQTTNVRPRKNQSTSGQTNRRRI